MTTQPDYRIYVASLSDYNAGTLHGAWIDCDGKDESELQEEVDAILESSKQPDAEEYAIHDHEGFGDLIGELSSLSEVAEIVEALESADDADALKEFAESYGYSLTEAGDHFDDAYCGQYNSEHDYAWDYLDSTGELQPDSTLSNYFDIERYARDLFMEMTYTESGHVFHDNH